MWDIQASPSCVSIMTKFHSQVLFNCIGKRKNILDSVSLKYTNAPMWVDNQSDIVQKSGEDSLEKNTCQFRGNPIDLNRVYTILYNHCMINAS